MSTRMNQHSPPHDLLDEITWDGQRKNVSQIIRRVGDRAGSLLPPWAIRSLMTATIAQFIQRSYGSLLTITSWMTGSRVG